MWYTARSSGLVAWVLLAASLVLGAALAGRFTARRPSPAWVLSIHRYLGGLACVFVGVHVAAIIGDSYVHFGLVDVLVPLASAWHPVAVAWGITAMWLLVAVELTSLARARLPLRLWRSVHLVSYPLFVVATVHLLSAGTDRWTRPVEAVVVVGTLAVAAASVAALVRPRPALRVMSRPRA
jgi:DMSO/TMAO reductase YedYZ heme-binding membrane subunit